MPRLFALLGFATVVALLVALAPAAPRAIIAQEPVALPALGDPVTFPTDEGEATITVTQIVDPFGAFGSGAPPEGARYVYIALTIANGGESELDFDTDTIFAVDTDGFVYRPADLFAGEVSGEGGGAASQSIDPGAEVDGGVVVAVPEVATLAAIYHDPAEDRLILLAILGAAPTGGGTTGDDDDQGGGEDEDGTGDDEDDGNGGDDDGGDEDAQPTAPPISGEVDCDDFTAYFEETTGRLVTLQETAAQLNDLIPMLTTDLTGAAASVAQWAEEIATLATEQEEAAVPAGLDDLNDQIVEAIATYADAFDQLAVGLGSLDVTAIQQVQTILQEGDTLLTAALDQLNPIAEECGLEPFE